jgi:hypothetical protein
MNKIYKLEIPRPQFDRIADAFELEDHYVNGYDADKDTVIFSVTEKQRLWFAKYAVQKIIKWKGKLKPNPYRWICKMFLPREIEKYLVK